MNKGNFGFIGIGVMGIHIANYLLRIVNNFNIIKRDSEKTLKFIRLNKSKKINIFESYKELASSSDVIISCVGNDDDLKKIYLGKDGIIAGLKKNVILIDHTTCSERISKDLYKKCNSRKCFFFDAPMSGGEVGAKEGKLSLMVGGKKEKFNDVKKITSLYSKSCVYMGPSGTGQLSKMVNQIFVACIIQGLAEGLGFAKQKNLNIKKIIQVTSNGAAQSWQLENRGSTMVNNKFNFGFMNKLMLKDLNLIVNCDNKGSNLPMTKQILKYYKKLVKMGYATDDTSSLIRLIK